MSHLDTIVWRSVTFAFSLKKLVMSAIFIYFVSVVSLFLYYPSSQYPDWVQLFFAIFPFYFSLGGCIALGVVCMRSYSLEVRRKKAVTFTIVKQSIPSLLMALHATIPLYIFFIVSFAVLSLFTAIATIPFIGDILLLFFMIVPLILLSLIKISLIVLPLALFCATPLIAFEGVDVKKLITRFHDVYSFSFLTVIGYMLLALIPFTLTSIVIWSGLQSMNSMAFFEHVTAFMFAQNMLLLAPVSCLLAPSLVIFFNISAEAYIYLKRAQ